MTKIAFDIGGTNMRVAVADSEGLGEVMKIPTPQNPEEGITAFAELAQKCANGEKIEAVAGGFPGAVIEGTIQGSPNLPHWEGVHLAEKLKEALGASIMLENDADIAALGEATYGAGRGKRVVAYIGIGTGVGGGRVVDGKIDTGAYGLEPGHQIVDATGFGDLESFVSGRAFEKSYGVHPKDAPRQAYEMMTPILAVGLCNTILHWSPEVLILGGSMVVGVNCYTIPEIEDAFSRLPSVPRMPELKMAELKDSAGLEGARALLSK
ncbi:ROK family protein [Candidatus Parcubacteria bacterium]|nr:MAG: ROK family protein [Candidatus Parcubacteria bacterium]